MTLNPTTLFCSTISLHSIHGGILKSAYGEEEKYEMLQLAAKLYFQLQDDLPGQDIVTGLCKNALGCVSEQKLVSFLAGQWIPARDRIQGDDPEDSRIEEGRFFNNFQNHIPLLEDFSAYIKSRPLNSVPYPVRQVMYAAAGNSFGDNSWPGTVLPPATFLPRKEELLAEFGSNATLEAWAANYTHPPYTYPHPGCRLKCRIKVLQENALPASLAGPPQEQNHVGFDGGKHTLDEEEESLYWMNAHHRALSFAANTGMYIFGLCVACIAAWIFVKFLLQATMLQMWNNQEREVIVGGLEKPSDMWLQRMRRQAMRVVLAANNSSSNNTSEMTSPDGRPLLSPGSRSGGDHPGARIRNMERVFDRLLYRTPSSFKAAVNLGK